MRTKAGEVRTLFDKLDKESRMFLGGPPYTEEIARELSNFESYKNSILPHRQRVCLGTCAFDSRGKVIGYISSTILREANPKKYERENIGLNNKLNYVQGKQVFVHPDHLRKNIATFLLNQSLNLAFSHDLIWVTDVKEENLMVVRFLEKNNVHPFFGWKTGKGTRMLRMKYNF